MILCDANNLWLSQILDHHRQTKRQPTKDEIRAICIGEIGDISRKFKAKFGDLVVCNDDRTGYWRTEFYPHYKAARKAARQESDFDFKRFYPMYDDIRAELAEVLPIKNLTVPGAEADDIMFILALTHASHEPVVSVSSDMDGLQAQQINPKAKQYCPRKRKMITPASESYDLFEHIVRGDGGDGVPNILSPDDWFVNPEYEGKRQAPVLETKIAEWRNAGGIAGAKEWCAELTAEIKAKNDAQREKNEKLAAKGKPLGNLKPEVDVLARFRQNRVLVDMRKIPVELAEAIGEAYENAKIPRGKVFGYAVEHGLQNVLRDGGF